MFVRFFCFDSNLSHPVGGLWKEPSEKMPSRSLGSRWRKRWFELNFDQSGFVLNYYEKVRSQGCSHACMNCPQTNTHARTFEHKHLWKISAHALVHTCTCSHPLTYQNFSCNQLHTKEASNYLKGHIMLRDVVSVAHVKDLCVPEVNRISQSS